MTKGISGLSGFGSSASVALTESLANRLKVRLGSDGSTEYSQTWKMKVTPAGRRYWAHTASARRTSDSDYSGWPTARATDHKGSSHPEAGLKAMKRGYGPTLPEAAGMARWPTPNARTEGGGDYTDPEKVLKRLSSGHQINLAEIAVMARWATPTTRDHKDTGDMSGSMVRKNGKLRNDVLGRQAWLSGAQTENRGALNPALSRWLMGYPPEWDDCAVMVTLSSRKPRRNS